MKAAKRFRSCLGPSITRYLALKRALGRRYTLEERALRYIDEFLASIRKDLTTRTFTSWCETLQHLTPTVRRNRMRIVRNCCLYRRRTEADCFVPDLTLFPTPHQAVKPYIFSKDEIVQLLAAAQQLQPTAGSPLRPEIYRLAVILLYTTGLRRGELIRLTLRDYDARQHTLFISQTKFHKSRYLPLSNDGVLEIERYLRARRARHAPMSPTAPLMWNLHTADRCFTGEGLAQGITALLRSAGIHKPNGRPPRVHDFRHCFAVHALLRWYESGVNVQSKLPLLATYMGHVSIVSTEYYLQFVEPLRSLACARFAKCCGALIKTTAKQKGGRQ